MTKRHQFHERAEDRKAVVALCIDCGLTRSSIVHSVNGSNRYMGTKKASR